MVAKGALRGTGLRAVENVVDDWRIVGGAVEKVERRGDCSEKGREAEPAAGAIRDGNADPLATAGLKVPANHPQHTCVFIIRAGRDRWDTLSRKSRPIRALLTGT